MDAIIIIFAIFFFILLICLAYTSPYISAIFLVAWFIIFIILPFCTIVIPPDHLGYSNTTVYPPGSFFKYPWEEIIVESTEDHSYDAYISTHTSDNIPIEIALTTLHCSIPPHTYQTKFAHNPANFNAYIVQLTQSAIDNYYNSIPSHSVYFNWRTHESETLQLLQPILDSKITPLVTFPHWPEHYRVTIRWGSQMERLYIRESYPSLADLGDQATDTSPDIPTDITDTPTYEPTINPNIPETYGTQEDIDNFVQNLMVREGRLNPDFTMNRSWYIQNPTYYDEWNDAHPTDPFTVVTTPSPTPTQIANSVICTSNGCTYR